MDRDALSFPPAFTVDVIPPGLAAVGEATRRAVAGAGPATLVWSQSGRALDGAIVLAPDEPLSGSAPVLFAGALALGDAMASLLPAGVEVDFAWPGVLRVNGREAGGVSLALPADARADAVPAWMVLGAAMQLVDLGDHGDADDEFETGVGAEDTSLEFEQCFGFTEGQLMAAFARYLLNWIHRRQADGFAPIRRTWTARAYVATPGVRVATADDVIDGDFVELTDAGDLVVETEGGRRAASLLAALGVT